MIVLDYTNRIDPTALKAVGAIGVCRYLSWASAAWKVIGKAEYDELAANGIERYLNWEFDARDWATANGGVHGIEAVRQAKALGHPAGKVIIGSADFDMSWAGWQSTGHAYASAFADAIRRGGYRPGVYGPWDVLQWVADAGIMDVFWQAGMSKAWSQGRNANPHPLAILRQMGHMNVAGTDTDWNEIRIPSGGKMKTAVIYRDPRNDACVLRQDAFSYGILNGEELRVIQALITAAGGDSKPRDVDPAGWGMLAKTGIDVVEHAKSATLTNVTVTQEQLNQAIAANVTALATAIMAHISIL